MSTNISISEGGKGYLIGPVKALMVEGDNGEFYLWYPEADRALDSLSVTQNGVYRAKDEGVYGWNRVSVNVTQADRVTGRDPDTGEEKTVTADPETGELVETVVPVEIRVTTPPTKIEYIRGETINYTGIVVHAYSANGEDMGEVPFNELVFPVMTADMSLPHTQGSASSDLDTSPVSKPIPFTGGGFTVEQEDNFWLTSSRFTATGGKTVRCFAVDYGYGALTLFIAAAAGGALGVLRSLSTRKDQTLPPREENKFFDSMSVYTYNGKTVYYWLNSTYWLAIKDSITAISLPIVTVSQNDIHWEEIAWTLIYGDVDAGGYAVPVQWPRTGDGAVLETSFNIQID